MCRRHGESTTRSGLRLVGRSAGSWYGCSSRFSLGDSPACAGVGFQEPGHVQCCTCHVGVQPGSGSAHAQVSAFSAVPV